MKSLNEIAKELKSKGFKVEKGGGRLHISLSNRRVTKDEVIAALDLEGPCPKGIGIYQAPDGVTVE
jgi:hypothetical protein